MAQSFPTPDVCSAATGYLVSTMDGVYRVLSFMDGESVYTHQIPRISREAQVAVIQQHPAFAETVAEAKQVTAENYRDWVARWIERHGETIDLEPMTAGEHERIDPISEVAEKVHPSRIAVVDGGRG